jgi:nitrate/nitrite-specific signal transduction histidine kinase
VADPGAPASTEAAPKETVEKLTADNARLRARIAELQAELHEATRRLAGTETHNQILQSLFVTTYRLHATLDPKEFSTTLREILVNIVGAEQFGLWLVSEESGAGDPILDEALEAGADKLSPEERGLARSASGSGEAWYAGDAPPPEGVRAQVILPLRGDLPAKAVLVVRRFLVQKKRLNEADKQILEVIADQAGIALNAARLLAASRKGKP